jgi:formylglycine-generating enzyme required for sulfatase activity
VWLFAAGVSTYDDPRLRLASAENDARAVDALFASMIEAPRRRFLDSSRATRVNLLGELTSLRHMTRDGDALIVYLSMHGMQGDHQRFFLLPRDARQDSPEITGISSDDLQSAIRPSPGEATHVEVVLDTCHSGAIASSDRDGPARVDPTAVGKFLLAQRGGVGVLSSSGKGEISIEDPAAGRGLFTEYFIQGLKGDADRTGKGNRDGRITFRELLDFIEPAVELKSNRAQHPQFTGDDGIWIQLPGASLTATSRPPPASDGCPPGMVRQPAGQFTMASHRPPTSLTCDYVTLDTFCIDADEITTGDYGRCSGCDAADRVAYAFHMSDEAQRQQNTECNANQRDHGDHPVNCVDFAQATAYCHAQGKRLPTEEEWEWAARRGSSGTPFPWGTAPPADQLCWSGVQHRTGSCPVGVTPLGDSAGGVHDLAGNVSEWTTNMYARGARVIRGGGWDTTNAGIVSAGARIGSPESLRSLHIGFRCAWPMDGPAPRVRNDMCH